MVPSLWRQGHQGLRSSRYKETKSANNQQTWKWPPTPDGDLPQVHADCSSDLQILQPREMVSPCHLKSRKCQTHVSYYKPRDRPRRIPRTSWTSPSWLLPDLPLSLPDARSDVICSRVKSPLYPQSFTTLLPAWVPATLDGTTAFSA